MLKTEKHFLLAGTVFYVLVFAFSCQQPFFWDTLLTSTIADWFYENGFQNFIVPLKWDAGHPVFFQALLTICWKIFGKSLVVSHAMMLPFLLLMMAGFVKLIFHLPMNTIGRRIGFLLFLAHPYLLTQSFLVSYDVLQVAGILWAVNGILLRRYFVLSASLLLLSALSLRAEIMAITLMMIALYFEIIKKDRKTLSIILAYFPAIALIAFWHIYHFIQSGWMIFSPSESWEGQRDIAGWKQMLTQSIGLARGFADEGMLLLSIAFALSFFYWWKKRSEFQFLSSIYLIIVILVAIHALMIIPFSNPAGHRYFMGIHVLMIVPVAAILSTFRWANFGFVILLLGFISGHWWIYPSGISNGWDVTLQHLHYHHARKALYNEISERKIPVEDIASGFPLFVSEHQAQLSGSTQRMQDITTMDSISTPYIAWSNVCNDFSDEKIAKIKHYPILFQYQKGCVQLILYRNPSIAPENH